MVNSLRFWDKIAPKYAKSPVSDVESWDKTLAQTRKYLGKDMDVLEIGAGTGSTALRIYEDVGSYRATDYSQSMTDIACDKFASVDADHLSVECATIFDEPANAYDAVLAYNLLHLVQDLPQTLDQIYKVLRSGGVFASKSATISGKYTLLRGPVWVMQKMGRAPLLNCFSQEKLEDMIKASGFEILQSSRIPDNFMNLFIVAKRN